MTIAIVPVVDLSALLGQARHQGLRSTCMAFAMSDLNRVTADAPDVLSAEFLYQTAGALIDGWRPSEGLYTWAAIRAISSPGQPLETAFPYQTKEPTGVGAPSAPPGARLFGSQVSTSHNTMQSVIDGLAQGVPVGLVTRMTQGFFNPVGGVVAHETQARPDEYHAILAVGWGTEPTSGSRYLFIRNSWGTGWALNGHAWLPEPFVDLHVLEAFGGRT